MRFLLFLYPENTDNLPQVRISNTHNRRLTNLFNGWQALGLFRPGVS